MLSHGNRSGLWATIIRVIDELVFVANKRKQHPNRKLDVQNG
jgi:hypothetical protein